MKDLVKRLLLEWGYMVLKVPETGSVKINDYEGFIREINKHNIKYTSIRDSIKDYEIVKKNSMVPFENLASLYEQVKMVEEMEIAGDFVECGVWKGGSIGMMALANMRYGKKRRHLHLFDAFEDICAPDPLIDGARALRESQAFLKKDSPTLAEKPVPMTGFYDFLGGHGTIAECRDLLFNRIHYDENFIHFYKGWFQDTFRKHEGEIEKIAILRLDGDWYESTRLSLEYFYEKVQEGGIVIIDDYGTYEGCKKAVDEFFQKRNIKKHLFNAYSLNAECFYLIK